MKWRYSKYCLWVINTKQKPELYLWDNWKRLLPSLDVLVNLTQEPAFIRSFQGYQYETNWLGFGRMKWNEKNNIKWTTKYINEKRRDQLPQFSHTEIWAPDWNRVCDNGMPPDIFIQLYNFPTLENIQEGIVIAMPRSLYHKNKVLVDTELMKLVSEIPGATISVITRRWYPGWKTGNEIGDINNQEIEKIVEGGM